jgi:hypothetical protein
MKLKEFMSNRDEKDAGSALAAVASTIAKDKNAVDKPLSSALGGLDSDQRNAVNREVQKLKSDGKNPQKLGDLVSAAAGDDVQEEVAKPVSKFARKA